MPSKIEFEPLKKINTSKKAIDIQEGGNHYKDFKIQPVTYIHSNGLSFLAGNVVKYVSRYRNKNGKEDLKKAIHCLQLLIELEYPNED